MRLESVPARRLRRLLLGACLLALAVAITQAQQSTGDAIDPRQAQDPSFAKVYKEWTGDARYGSPLVDHLPLVKGVPTPKDVLGYYVGAPQKLTYYADILKYYRALAAATPRVKVETIGRSDEGRELVVVWVSVRAEHEGAAGEPRPPREARGPAGTVRRGGPPAHRGDQAELPPDRRPAQQRERAVRDADGTGLPAGHRDVAAHHRDPQQRLRVGDAGRRSRRSRSLRRLVLPGARDARRSACRAAAARTRAGRAAARAAAAAPPRRPVSAGASAGARPISRARTAGRRNDGRPLLGQVRLPRQQPRHQPGADGGARADRLVLHGAPDRHARPARVDDADVHLQRRPAAESESRPAALRRAARGSRTGNSRR